VTYIEHAPKAPLSAFIQRMWYCSGQQPAHRVERVMPSGAPALVIALERDWLTALKGPRLDVAERGAASLLVAPRMAFEVVATADFAGLAGVQFQPWGLRAFFPGTAEIARCGHADLEALWGADARRLRERLRNLPSANEVFAEMERAFLRRLQPFPQARPMAAAVHSLQADRSPHAVWRASSLAECTQRHLHRLFLSHLGLSPKQYHRVRRFRHALDVASQRTEIDWADLALSCGYSDQSHFVREFRVFSGINPSAYFTRRGAWTGHLPLDPARIESPCEE
jgi:AraC-like DNA-binding protein